MQNCKDFVDYIILSLTIIVFFSAPYIGLAIIAKFMGII